VKVLVSDTSSPSPALHLALAEVEMVLVAVGQAGDDDLLAGDDGRNGRGQAVHVAVEGAQHEGLGVRQLPPVAGALALVPVGADAGLAARAVVEEDGALARLGPGHDVLPLARVETALADVVLDDRLGVVSLEVLHLLVQDEVLVLVDAHHLDDDDVRRFAARAAQGVRGFDVAAGLGAGSQDGEGGQDPNAHRGPP
jgi:hypothetical protein